MNYPTWRDRCARNRSPLAGKHFSKCGSATEFLARELDGSDYAFGELYFPFRCDRGVEYTFGSVPELFFTPKCWVPMATATVVVRPEWGALVLVTAEPVANEPDPEPIERLYEWACKHQSAVRDYFFDDLLWRGRSLAVATAVVVEGHAETVPPGVPAEVVLAAAEPGCFVAQLEALFDYVLDRDETFTRSEAERFYAALADHPTAAFRGGDWFISLHESIDHDIALIEEHLTSDEFAE